MDTYKNLVYGLADYLGDGYEIVLHSLENYASSVIAIINGHHTNREINSPITDLALKMITEIENKQTTDYISYYSKNKNNEPLKSTTIAIRGTNKKVIGLLCMNLYLNTPFSSILESFIPPQQAIPITIPEQYHKTTSDLFEGIFGSIQSKVMSDSTITFSNKNKAIVEQLYAQGIFNLKDSALHVADALNISKNTVYLHLRNIKKNNQST